MFRGSGCGTCLQIKSFGFRSGIGNLLPWGQYRHFYNSDILRVGRHGFGVEILLIIEEILAILLLLAILRKMAIFWFNYAIILVK